MACGKVVIQVFESQDPETLFDDNKEYDNTEYDFWRYTGFHETAVHTMVL